MEVQHAELRDEFLRGYHARGAELLGQKRRPRVAPIIVAALIVALAILGATFLYVGATHRDRCTKAGNVGCTILPWSGHSNGGWGTSYLLPSP